jgi:thioredoxin
MATDATVETFPGLVARGPVLLDIWGPQCAPCMALMPAVEELERRYEGGFRLLKLNAPDNRKVCRDLRVIGLPTYITFLGGIEVERLTGNDTSAEDVRRAIDRLLRRAARARGSATEGESAAPARGSATEGERKEVI